MKQGADEEALKLVESLHEVVLGDVKGLERILKHVCSSQVQ